MGRGSVFISYRRQLSWSLALLVRAYLIKHRFDTFMDVENLDSGEFPRAILSEIEAREHFIVLLQPGSLDHIGEDGDWLRREIAHALARGRNVVPVTADRFEFRRDLMLPPDVARLASFNAVAIQPGYFDAAMERLRTRFLKKPPNPAAPPLAETRSVAGDASVVVTAPGKELHGEATNHGVVVHPATATLEVTVPEGFDVRHPNRLRAFRMWLSNPIETGSDPSSKKYPIEGRVAPLLPGGAVAIAIRTNQWYEQGVFALRPDGSFSGHVYLHESLPPAAVRFRILGADDSILKEYVVQVA